MNQNMQAAAAAKKARRNTILIIVAVVVVAAAVIGLAVYANTSSSTAQLRESIALSSENYEVNGAMMTYFFYNTYQSYASILSLYYGLDTSQSLKSQYYSDDATWFDYMAAMSASSVQEILSLCEAAHAEGMTLDDEDQLSIENNMKELSESAAASGYTVDAYLMRSFGSAVSETDVRDCLNLIALASKYATKFSDSLSYTTADYEQYYEENKTSYDGVDLITYTVKQDDLLAKDEDGNPTGNVADAAAKAEEAAAAIAANTTEESFVAAIAAYVVENLGYSEEDAATLAAQCYVEHLSATAGNEASDWAFSANSGDTTVISESGGSSYSVYFLLREAYRDETPTRSVRHILLDSDTYEDAHAEAEEVMALWAADDYSLDTFEELVVTYSVDTGSTTTGGLYENVTQGEMITEFDEWLFDSARTPGDHDLIETSYGWHIMYYVGEGQPNWVCDADEALRNNAYTELVSSYASSIEMDAEVIYSITA